MHFFTRTSPRLPLPAGSESLPILAFPGVREQLEAVQEQELVQLAPRHLMIFDVENSSLRLFSLARDEIVYQCRSFLVRIYASLLAICGGLVIHGAGCSISGRGALVIGPSGAGKSTAVKLMGFDSLLSDDLIAITGATGTPVIHGTPLGGLTDGDIKAPLAAIFFPTKADTFSLAPLAPRDALRRYFLEHAEYVGTIFEPHIALTLKNAHALFNRVPSYEMSFSRDCIAGKRFAGRCGSDMGVCPRSVPYHSAMVLMESSSQCCSHSCASSVRPISLRISARCW